MAHKKDPRRSQVGAAAPGLVDIHCHCLPGLDDGPATLVEAIALCRALVHDGVSTVVASPHQLGRYGSGNSGSKVRDAVDALQVELTGLGIPLTVLPGAEVRMDQEVPELVGRGEVLTLADRNYLLLELPDELDVDPMPLIRQLAALGIRAVIAHPERYCAVCRHPDIVKAWVDAGAAMQVTGGSLIGEFGPEALRVAWWLLSESFPVVVASDAHDSLQRPPRLSLARQLIDHEFGPQVAQRTCRDNPGRILGVPQIPPLAREGTLASPQGPFIARF